MSNRNRESRRRIGGFSLIEMVMVFIAISILGVIVMIRFQPSEITVTVEADHLARDIRHMQMLAMTWREPLRLTFPTVTRYQVVCVSGSSTAPCAGAGAVTDPATGQPLVRDLQNNVTVAGANFELDTLGRPVNGVNLLTANRVFTLTGGGRPPSTVTVIPITGFVNVVY